MLLLVGLVWLYEFVYESRLRRAAARRLCARGAGRRHDALSVPLLFGRRRVHLFSVLRYHFNANKTYCCS